MRVHEIARAAGTDSKTVRTYVAETFGMITKSPSSVIGPPAFAETLVKFLREKHRK